MPNCIDISINVLKYIVLGAIILIVTYFATNKRLLMGDVMALTAILVIAIMSYELTEYVIMNGASTEKFTENNGSVKIKLPDANGKGVQKEIPKEISKEIPKEMPKDKCKSDMPYSDYSHIPMGEVKDNFVYGFSFLPPEKWYPTPPNPPVCVTDNRSQICPVYTFGMPFDALDWNDSLKVLQPDNINIKFVEERLNKKTK